VVVEADPIPDHATGVLQGLEAVPMDALVLQRSDDSLDHAVLLGRIGRDEFLLQPVTLDQGGVATLAGYDFSFQPSLDRDRILALAQLEFIDRRQCVHFLGPPGTGKSHLAIALGVQAVKAGKSVFFATLAEIVDSMRKAERECKLRERVKFLSRYDLLIVDEIGYLPIGHGGGNLFFQLVNVCYERSAMVMTSNRGFGDWAEIFGDPVVATALLDRLLHHAVVIPIEGNSYRLREHAALIPEHLRLNRPSPTELGQAPVKRGPGRPRKYPLASNPG
jgi:DNA replication protein DnaC